LCLWSLAATSSAVGHSPDMTNRFLVLAVDDRESNRIALRAVLRRFPEFELIEASSGEAALLCVMERPVQLLLLDVNMPGMDGFEVVAHLQSIELTREIPVIFLTATAKEESFVQRGYELGAVDYLAKPIEDHLLISRLRIYKRLYESRQQLQASNRSLEQTMQELRETQQSLLQHQKLAALMPMVSAVAHELNTPLGNCQLTLSILRDSSVELLQGWRAKQGIRRSELENYIHNQLEASEILSHSLGRAIEIVARFKQISLSDHNLLLSQFDLADLLAGALGLHSAELLARGIQVRLDVPAGIQMRSCIGPLSRALDELLANSLLHGFAGRSRGSIGIRARLSGPAAVEICYSDDGLGMSPEVLAKAFDPFFTTRFGQGSSGLGLSIAYNLVTGLLGGELQANSVAGQGCEFILNLPLAASPPQP